MPWWLAASSAAVAQRHAEIGGVPQHGHARQRRHSVPQDFEALGAEHGRQFRHAGDVAAGPRHPVDQAGCDRIARCAYDDRYVSGRLFGGQRRGIAECHDDIYIGGLKLGCEAVESLGARVGRSLHENKVLAVDEAVRGQNGEKDLPTLFGRAHRDAADEQPHAIDFPRLLRWHRERPSGRYAAERG
jgi:hypothetical protein